jgi:hypothetical protein
MFVMFLIASPQCAKLVLTDISRASCLLTIHCNMCVLAVATAIHKPMQLQQKTIPLRPNLLTACLNSSGTMSALPENLRGTTWQQQQQQQMERHGIVRASS